MRLFFPQTVSQYFAFLEHDYQIILNIQQPKNVFIWVKIPKRSTLPSLSPAGHFLHCRMWHVPCHLFRASKHVIYGVWAPTYLAPPYRKCVVCKGRVQGCNRHKHSSSHTHFAHRRGPSYLLAMLIVNWSASHTFWNKAHFEKNNCAQTAFSELSISVLSHY